MTLLETKRNDLNEIKCSDKLLLQAYLKLIYNIRNLQL